MPYCYCHDEECDLFDIPQWVISGDSPQPNTDGYRCDKLCGNSCAALGPCDSCAKRRHARPKIPAPVRRFQSASEGGLSPLPKLPSSGAVSASPLHFYCQNPNQSGDTTGVGVALGIFDEMNLLFFVSVNSPQAARGFLTYYQDMGAEAHRVVLLVGDAEVEERKLTKKQLRAEAEKSRAESLEELKRESVSLDEELKEIIAELNKCDGFDDAKKPLKQRELLIRRWYVHRRQKEIEALYKIVENRSEKGQEGRMDEFERDFSYESSLEDYLKTMTAEVDTKVKDSADQQTSLKSELKTLKSDLKFEENPEKKVRAKFRGKPPPEGTKIPDKDPKEINRLNKKIEEIEALIDEMEAKIKLEYKNVNEVKDLLLSEEKEAKKYPNQLEEREDRRKKFLTTMLKASQQKNVVRPHDTKVSSSTMLLSEMPLEVLLLLLRKNDWPFCPLLAPKELCPSIVRAECQTWQLVDPCTALDAVRSDLEDLDAELFDIDLTLEFLPGWLDETMNSPEQDTRIGALDVASKDLASITRKHDNIHRHHSAIGKLIGNPKLPEVLAMAAKRQTGVRLPEILAKLRVAACYQLWKVTTNSEPFLVIARDAADVSSAVQCLDTTAITVKVLCKLGETPKPTRGRNKRFEFTRDLLCLRLARRDKQAMKFAESYEEFLSKTAPTTDNPLRTLVGRIVPWNYFDERAGNQLYQGLTGTAIKLRDDVVAVQPAPLEHHKGAYQTLMRIPDNEYYPISDTSRNILAILQQEGVTELTKRIYQKLNPGCIIVGPALRENFLDGFLQRFEEPAKGKQLTLVLIWVRGVNNNEMRKLQQGSGSEGFNSKTVDDQSKKKLDSLKRNPHHVMTPQLCAQLVTLFEHFNIEKSEYFPTPDPNRYFVPVVIGDPVYIDQYDHTSQLVFAPGDDNMITLWTRRHLKEAIGGPHWRYRQVCMMRELFTDPRFDLMQTGIRSGALEQGMYQCGASIYIEEHLCSTGDRMVSLTRDGPTRAVLDAILRSIGQENMELALTLRIAVDWALATNNSKHMTDVDFPGEYKDKVSLIIRSATQIIENRGKLPPPPEQETFPPVHDPVFGGFPLFFRLITVHLVGLNQARSQESLERYVERFKAFLQNGFTPETKDEEILRVYKGGLENSEIKLLRHYVEYICKNYDSVKSKVYGTK